MSLINEALKKAQKQRTGDAPPLASMPAIGGESAVRIAKRGKPTGINALLIRASAGAAALAVVAIGAFFLLRSKPSGAPAKPAIVATESVKPATVATAANPPASAATAPTFVIPSTPPPATVAQAPRPEPVSARPEPAKPVAVAAKVEPEPVAPAPAGPAPKMDGKAIDFIEAIRVAGIRASATDSKVLMNDRVYRVGDTVERQLGLKLVGITASSLTFEDERGARYTRNF